MSVVATLLVSVVWTVVLLLAPAGAAVVWLAGLSALVLVITLLGRWPIIARPIAVEVVALGVIIGVVTLALTHVIAPPVLHAIPAWSVEFAALYGGEVAGTPLPLALTLALTCVVIVGEEVVWRGLALSALRQRMPEGLAIGASAVLYAACQLGFRRTLPAAAALVLGLVWGWLRVIAWRGGGLTAPIVAHAIWTLGVLWWWPLG